MYLTQRKSSAAHITDVKHITETCALHSPRLTIDQNLRPVDDQCAADLAQLRNYAMGRAGLLPHTRGATCKINSCPRVGYVHPTSLRYSVHVSV
jgi:hypothetical protein